MRMKWAGIALALLLVEAPAGACSMAPGYRVPTSLELAERADTILLGTVESEIPAPERGLGQVVMRPTLLLKGSALPAVVKIPGYISNGGARAVASDPLDLKNPNPGALTGGCTRYVFDRNMILLLFLERRDGALILAPYSFARSAEDVPSADSLWVRAVRFYVEVAALPAAQRKRALVDRRDSLRASADPESMLLAEDIDRQIKRKRIPPYD